MVRASLRSNAMSTKYQRAARAWLWGRNSRSLGRIGFRPDRLRLLFWRGRRSPGLAVGMVEQHAVADVYFVADEVACLVIAYAVPWFGTYPL